MKSNLRWMMFALGIISATMVLTQSVSGDRLTEDYSCQLWIKDLVKNRLETRSRIPMSADSRARRVQLPSWKVTTQIDIRSNTAGNLAGKYWTNKRAVTLIVADKKDRIQAQLNNTVPNLQGAFEYQTQTTQLGIMLSCEPLQKRISAR